MPTIKKLKPILVAAVVLLTISLFAVYLHAHPSTLRQLGRTNPWLVLGLLSLYALFMVSLILVQQITLRLSKLHIPGKDNAMLAIYSMIINFFGPLQSGPGFRGVYLKRKFGVSVKRYTMATLGYYGCFGFWSAAFIATGFNWRWWLAVLAVAVVAVVASWKTLRHYTKAWQWQQIILLFLATLAQLAIVALIYFCELHSLDKAITFHQALIYAGVANFALFVSITPGAIGFRESFVIFTEKLHHIPTTTIVSASLLDRATYIVLLAILFIVTLIFHAQQRLGVGQPVAPGQSARKNAAGKVADRAGR